MSAPAPTYASSERSRRGRLVLSRVLLTFGVIVVIVSTVLGWASRTFLDDARFSATVRQVAEDPKIRVVLVDEVVRQIETANPDLVAVRPVVESAVRLVVESPAFGDVVERAARDVQRTITSAPRENATLTSVKLVTLVVGTLRDVDPAIAAQIPDNLEVDLVRLRDGLSALRIWELANRVRALAAGIAVLGAGLLVGAVLAAPDRRRATTLVGHGLVIAGGTVIVVVAVARALLVSGIASAAMEDAVRSSVDAFVDPLTDAATLTILIGILIAAASLATRAEGPRVTPTRLLDAVRRAFLFEPRTTGGRLVRGGAFLVVGLAALRYRDAILPFVVGVTGILLAYAGLVFVFQVIGRDPLPASEFDRERRSRRRRLAHGVAIAVIVACLVGAIGVIRSAGDAPASVSVAGTCNGHAALCERRLDQVAFAATHNSMSNAADGYLNALQTTTIPAQLDSGIRGLLVDLYDATAWKGTVYTDFNAQKTAEITDQVGSDLAARALELRDIVGPPADTTAPELYFCHGFCELGATKALPQMQAVRDFMKRNPNEVVIMIIQDYVKGSATERLFRESGLDRYVYRGSGDPWPTLGELVASDRRLVVFSENFGGKPAWLRPFPANFQETPYGFADVAELESPASCDPGRGRPDSGLFLLNHWLTPGTATEAQTVNSAEVLGGRAERCRVIRSHLPNVVAVDFAAFGDLLGVVDTLNGFPAASGPSS